MKQIKLNGKYGSVIGNYALVDDEDYEELSKYKWHCLNNNYTLYVATKQNNTSILMHRLILKIVDKKLVVDHKDHNGLNNQRNNLRVVTGTQNQANRIKHINSKKKCSSIYKGVYYNTADKSWVARCECNNKKLTKYCKTEIEAAIAYNELIMELHGEYALINILTDEHAIEYENIVKDKEKNKDKILCTLCKNYLPYSSFWKNPRNIGRNGYDSWCSKCTSEYNINRRKKNKSNV